MMKGRQARFVDAALASAPLIVLGNRDPAAARRDRRFDDELRNRRDAVGEFRISSA